MASAWSRFITPNQPTSIFMRSFRSFEKLNIHKRRKRLSFSWISLSILGGGVGVLAFVALTHTETDDVRSVNENERRKVTCHRRGAKITFEKAVTQSRDILQRIKDETGCPGMVIGVSVDGNTVWTEGIGFSDVENRVVMKAESVLRIASISKPITMAIAAKLMEAGLLDIDAPVQKYVPYFPEKTVDGKKVIITPRLLFSNLAGIRHYDKKEDEKGEKNGGKKNKAVDEFALAKKFSSVEESVGLFINDCLFFIPGTSFLYTTHGWTLVSAVLEGSSGIKFPNLFQGLLIDLGMENTYLDKNKPLIYHRARNYVKNKKGRLVNAPYVDLSYKWAGGGMLSTVGDLLTFGNVMLYSYQQNCVNIQTSCECINKKSLHFMLNKTKDLLPIVINKKESSFTKPAPKLTESEYSENVNQGQSTLPGYLRQSTMKEMWSVVKNTECSWAPNGGYGMGWGVVPEQLHHGAAAYHEHYLTHTGGAMGASSVLLIYPSPDQRSRSLKTEGPGTDLHCSNDAQQSMTSNSPSHPVHNLSPVQSVQSEMEIFDTRPKGITVAIIANLSGVGLNKTALTIAKLFELIE